MKNPFKKYEDEEYLKLEEELRNRQSKKEKKRYLNPNAKAFLPHILPFKLNFSSE